MSALEINSILDAREAVTLACRLHGKQRGWAVAADLLGITERTARAIDYGETTGARVSPDIAFNARMALRRQRAEQIRAELRQLETENATFLDDAGASMGVGW